MCLVGVCGQRERERERERGGGWRDAGLSTGEVRMVRFCGCESLYRKNQPQWKLKPPRSLTHHAHSRAPLPHTHPAAAGVNLHPKPPSPFPSPIYIYISIYHIYIYLYTLPATALPSRYIASWSAPPRSSSSTAEETSRHLPRQSYLVIPSRTDADAPLTRPPSPPPPAIFITRSA